MIGRAVWWLVCRVFEVPLISEEMLDEVGVVIREEAGRRGVVLGEAGL